MNANRMLHNNVNSEFNCLGPSAHQAGIILAQGVLIDQTSAHCHLKLMLALALALSSSSSP